MWDSFYDYAKFTSYADFATDYKRCRNAKKGRPVKGWCRLFKEGPDYVIKLDRWRNDSIPLFRVSPDETVTFYIPSNDLLRNAQSVVASLYRIIPFILERKRKGIYALGGTHRSRSKSYSEAEAVRRDYWYWLRTKAPEYFPQIKFNLVTGECLNARPNLMDSVVPEVRRQWLRDVKRYKKGLKVRAKVGALQGHITRALKPTWPVRLRQLAETNSILEKHETLQHIVECMCSETYPPDVLHLLVATTPASYTLTDKMVLENVDRLFNIYSLQLRTIYGVFGAR